MLSSEDHRLVVMIWAGGTQWAYTDTRVAMAARPSVYTVEGGKYKRESMCVMGVCVRTRGLLATNQHAGGGLQVLDGCALGQELGVAENLHT